MDSLSAQLLTEPYTALHEASEAAVADTAEQLRVALRDALDRSPAPGLNTNTPEGRKGVADLLGEHLAPLVARYAHAITGVQTLRALLNAGTLEFSMEGTVKRMSELLEKVVDLADSEKWEPGDTSGFMLAAIDLGVEARELLADFRDAEPNPHDIGIAGRSVETLPEPEAPADVVAGDEAITVAVDAPNDPTKAPALELGRVGALRSAGYPAPYYEVYCADTGRQAPHCTTPTYEAALSYCRASHGTPWHILEINDQGEALLVTDVKIDGTVVELYDRLPPFHVAEPEPAQPPEKRQEMAREVAAAVWFEVRRTDVESGIYCSTQHYALALEYCQGSPGSPWSIWQNVIDSAPVLVTTVGTDGDVTEVGERGAS